MLLPVLISLLVGMVLGQRFKVLILMPAILLTVVIALGAGIARADASWTSALITAAVTIVGLQVGYLLGIATRRLRVLARVGRLRSASLPNSLPPHRPAH